MSDNNFIPISLAKIKADAPLCADIYLAINEKYIKFKHAGDFISSEKYDLFLSKNVSHVYIDAQDELTFNNWLQEQRAASISEVTQEIGEEYVEEAKIREELAEGVYETFSTEELNAENVKKLQSQVEDLVDRVGSQKLPQQVLARLRKKSNTLADHAVNVANTSVYLAMVLGHVHQYVLENIYYGALFHDYGKAKIPSKVLEDPTNISYSKAIEEHPKKGAELLSKVGDISENVIKIVEQHHEQYDGKGFPKGLKEDEIYELSQIVSLANVFENVCSENMQKSNAEMTKQAIKFLEFNGGKKFDPELTITCVEALYQAHRHFESKPEES